MSPFNGFFDSCDAKIVSICGKAMLYPIVAGVGVWSICFRDERDGEFSALGTTRVPKKWKWSEKRRKVGLFCSSSFLSVIFVFLTQ